MKFVDDDDDDDDDDDLQLQTIISLQTDRQTESPQQELAANVDRYMRAKK